jgi:hypothetical protein
MKGLVSLSIAAALAAAGARPAAAQGDPSDVGQWSAVQPFPIVSVHSILLRTGKVMFWAYDNVQNFYTWDPATGGVSAVANAGRNVFCAGHSALPDGRIFVPGGHDQFNGRGLKSASIYNPIADSWTPVPDMNRGRWYPSSTTLANGDVLVTSGSYNVQFAVNRLPQVYRVATNTWRNLTNANLAMTLYPHTYLAPNGRVFFATQTSRYLDTAGTGAWSFVANHNVPGRENYGSSALYADGKVVLVGGADPPTATCETIDLNAPTPAWTMTGSMASARRQHTVTLLPDGTLLVTGGSSAPGFNNPAGAVHAAEIWDPATGNWSTMASSTRYRGYHSTATLLPDGRVLSSGGDSESNAEVFSPPYLFKGARPTITSAPATVNYAQTFAVNTPDAAAIANVNWIRLGALTHAQNWDQRINQLGFTAGNGVLQVTAPTSPRLCPPGFYMLFILNGSGVPSQAKIVRIRPGIS